MPLLERNPRLLALHERMLQYGSSPPAPNAVAAQAFAMDFEVAQADLARADAADAAQREEEELLSTLGLGKTVEELREEERKRLEREAQGRPWNSD